METLEYLKKLGLRVNPTVSAVRGIENANVFKRTERDT